MFHILEFVFSSHGYLNLTWKIFSVMSFGIALPSWIVEKENSIWVLGLYTLVFMVALPTVVVSQNSMFHFPLLDRTYSGVFPINSLNVEDYSGND